MTEQLRLFAAPSVPSAARVELRGRRPKPTSVKAPTTASRCHCEQPTLLIEDGERRCHQCGRHVADEATLEAVHLVGRHERPDLAFALTNVVVLCDRCRPGRRASGNF